MSSDSGKATTTFLFMIGFGVFGFFHGFSRLRKKRMIENIPTSKIRGMAMGTVEIIGKTEIFRTALNAPFTMKPCVYYRYEVEELRSNGKSSNWETIEKGDSGMFPFFINDGTGRVLISPKKIEAMIDYDFRTEKWKGTAIESFLSRQSIRSSGFFGFSKRLRFTEWRIQPEEKIYVLGYAEKDQDFLVTHGQELMIHFESIKADKEKMKEFDLDRDGEISPQEWHFAKSAIEQEFIEARMKNARPDEHFDVVIQYNPHAKMFLLSDKSQKDLLRSLGWEIMLSVWGGAALALLGLFLLLLQFNLF